MPKYKLTKPRFLDDNRRYPGRGEVVETEAPQGVGMEQVDKPAEPAAKPKRKPKSSKPKAAKARKSR